MLYFRMSEAGVCIKALAAEKLGYEPLPFPPYIERILKESRRHEAMVVEDLREEGYKVERADGPCPKCAEFGERAGIHVEMQGEGFTLVGHLDGKIVMNGGRVLEIKALGESTFHEAQKKGLLAVYPEYGPTMTCYMHATGLKGLWAVKNRNTGERLLIPVDSYPIPLDSILDCFYTIHLFLDAQALPEPDDPCTDSQRYRCRYNYLCPREPVEKEVEAVQDVGLNAAIELWREGKGLEEDGKRKLEEAKEVILRFAQMHELKRFSAAGAVVSYYGERSRPYFDEALLKELVSADVLEKTRKLGKPWFDIRVRDIQEG